MHTLLLLFAAAGGAIVLYALGKRRLPFFLLAAAAGVAAFFAADLVGGLFSFRLPLNAFTLAVSAVGGVPGVILLCLLPLVL